MKRAAPEYVLVMDANRARPKFHKLGWAGRDDRTFCGYEQGSYRDRVVIPRRHAEKFCDPCKFCWR